MRKAFIISVTITYTLLLIIFVYPFVSSRIWDSQRDFARENRCELDGLSFETEYRCENNKELETRINRSFDRHGFIEITVLLFGIPSLVIMVIISAIIGYKREIESLRK